MGATVWLICAPDFEPVITALGLLASLLAIFIDRIVSEREQRKEILVALFHEHYMNVSVIEGLNLAKKPENIDSPHVYPRFFNSSLSYAISTGKLSDKRDKKLWKLMNSWLQYSIDFNNRLTITEVQTFGNPSIAKDFNTKIMEGETSVNAIKIFNELSECLLKEYKTETKIDENTEIFGT